MNKQQTFLAINGHMQYYMLYICSFKEPVTVLRQ